VGQILGEVDVAVDLGCGAGTSIAPILEQLQPKRVFGVDNSDAQLAIARETFPNVTFHKADVRGGAVRDLLGQPNLVAATRLVVGHIDDPLESINGWFDALGHNSALALYEWDGPLLSPAEDWPDFDGHRSPVRDALDAYYVSYEKLWREKGNTLFPGDVIKEWMNGNLGTDPSNFMFTESKLDLTVEQGLNVVFKTLPKLVEQWKGLGNDDEANALASLPPTLEDMKTNKQRGLFGWKMAVAYAIKR
jgi:SAM-dependent methyltransferase